MKNSAVQSQSAQLPLGFNVVIGGVRCRFGKSFSPMIRQRLLAVLQMDGRFEVYLARNGEDAFSLCRMHMPALAILDVMMSRVHGLKVCKQLKEARVPLSSRSSC